MPSTADEDDKNSGNIVLTSVIHPSQKAKVVNTLLTHHSLTRLYEDVVGAPYLNAATTAPSMSDAFALPVASQRPANELSCTTTPPPVLPVSKNLVTGFAVTAQGPNAIVMKWKAVPNAVKYRIQFSTKPTMERNSLAQLRKWPAAVTRHSAIVLGLRQLRSNGKRHARGAMSWCTALGPQVAAG